MQSFIQDHNDAYNVSLQACTFASCTYMKQQKKQEITSTNPKMTQQASWMSKQKKSERPTGVVKKTNHKASPQTSALASAARMLQFCTNKNTKYMPMTLVRTRHQCCPNFAWKLLKSIQVNLLVGNWRRSVTAVGQKPCV